VSGNSTIVMVPFDVSMINCGCGTLWLVLAGGAAAGFFAFVWAWMGALGAQTSHVRFGPGVTAETMLFHAA